MVAQSRTQTQAAPSAPATQVAGISQRTCACGQHTIAGEECAECRRKRAGTLQRAVAGPGGGAPPARPPAAGLGHEFARVGVRPLVTSGLAVSRPGDPDEQEAERVAAAVVGSLDEPAAAPVAPALSRAAPRIQRQVADEFADDAAEPAPAEPAEEEAPEPEEAPETAADEEPGEAEEQAPAGLIVEDDAADVGPDQLRKSEFLDQLRAEVCMTAEAILATVGRSTDGCPYLDYWFGYYRDRDSQHIERAIHRYAPETADATRAQAYIPLITAQVGRAVTVWATTGEITGVPEGVAAGPAGGGAAAETGETRRLLFKGREGLTPAVAEPRAVQGRLGAGRVLEGGVRSRMEAAFGQDFSGVQVHTGSRAAGLSAELNARAFTIGRDVAFGAGEYQPGTPIGDALIAHELAHVVQQRGAESAPTTLKKGGDDGALEQDADNAALGAVVSLWSNGKAKLRDVARQAVPGLKSGLKLQRCCTPTAPAPRLTITQLSPPEMQDCGGVEWPIQFGLTGARSNTKGWIVQNVNTTFNVTDCDNNPVNVLARSTDLVGRGFRTTPGRFPVTMPTDPSWWPFSEAWRVKDGIVRFGDSSAPHRNDTYRSVPFGPMAGVPDTKGTVSIQGTADYFDCLDLPSSFGTGKTPIPGLPLARPPVTLTGGSGALAHNIAIRWNCCPGAPPAERRTIVDSKTP